MHYRIKAHPLGEPRPCGPWQYAAVIVSRGNQIVGVGTHDNSVNLALAKALAELRYRRKHGLLSRMPRSA